MIIIFNPNQAKVNLLQFEYIDFLRNRWCSDVSISSYVRCIRTILNKLGIILPKAPKINITPKSGMFYQKKILIMF